MVKTQRTKGLGFPATSAARAAWLHGMAPDDGTPHPYGDDWADPILAEILADALWGDENPRSRCESKRGRRRHHPATAQCAEGQIRCVRCGAYRNPDQFEPRRSVCTTCVRRLGEVQSKTAQNRVRNAIKAGSVDKLLKKHQPRLASEKGAVAHWALPGDRYSARQEKRLAEIGAREWLVRWLLDPENGSPLIAQEA